MHKSDIEQTRLRLKQEALRAEKTQRPVAGRFLAGEEIPLAGAAAKEAGVQLYTSSGWAAGERVQPCFVPEAEEPAFSLCWLGIAWAGKFQRMEHSDLLGSLMALGIDRSWFGDLVMQGDKAYLCALPEVAQRLPMEWQQAGRAAIRVTLLEDAPPLTPPAGDVLRDTVPSLRLDCILASGMRLSRSKAAETIRQGLVMVDHVPEERCDRLLSVGQLCSIRHFGRIRLLEAGEPTRKDRLPIRLEVFRK